MNFAIPGGCCARCSYQARESLSAAALHSRTTKRTAIQPLVCVTTRRVADVRMLEGRAVACARVMLLCIGSPTCAGPHARNKKPSAFVLARTVGGQEA